MQRSRQNWISVKRRLPEPYIQVIIATKVGRQRDSEADYIDEHGTWHRYVNVNVTHWMPMPIPPN